jgi:mono/diheme cytochrome c family protein
MGTYDRYGRSPAAEDDMRGTWSATSFGFLLLFSASPLKAAEDADGKALLEKNCSRCHAVTLSAVSPLAAAPNLWTVLRSYPTERLEFELAEGIGSRHRDMPQVQFSTEEIRSIVKYLDQE